MDYMNKMNIDFVESLYKSIIVEHMELYENIFNTAVHENMPEYRKKTLEFYNNLSQENKEVLMGLLKQSMINAISNLLGIIDGSSTLNDCDLEPKLLLDNKDTENELQDTFLAYIEENHMK